MKKGLLFRFGIVFFVFTVVTISTCGVLLYGNQMGRYKKEREESIQQMVTYLDSVITADGEEFLWYQDYFLKHTKDLLIPHDFGPKERDEAAERYLTMFAQAYPGKVLGVDVDFYDLPEEIQEAYTIYNHMYYLLLFEEARDSFNLAYTYYITPLGDEPYTVCYVLDAFREERWEGDKCYIAIADSIFEDPEKHTQLWKVWEAGTRLSGFDHFDNELGKTYAYFLPLYIGETKAGLISAEVDIETIDHGILMQTLRQVICIAAILIIATILLLIYINKNYITKIQRLSDGVREYSMKKDPNIAFKIEVKEGNTDEISTLSNETAAMILELDIFMKNLISTTKQLEDAREEAHTMHELAHRDSLTGVLNKTAYDREVKQLSWGLEDHMEEFGIAMVDLNFLKRINDTYGHEKGNYAIKRLCGIICDVFKHSPVFRIGGDEFVVVLRGRDYENIEKLTVEFNKRLDELKAQTDIEPWKQVSAAFGYALYDKDKDGSVENVFKRADKAMYNRKMEMKAVRLE